MQYALQDQELLTIREAAHLIRVHPNTLRNWEKKGMINAIRIGSRRDRRFVKASILDVCQGFGVVPAAVSAN